MSDLYFSPFIQPVAEKVMKNPKTMLDSLPSDSKYSDLKTATQSTLNQIDAMNKEITDSSSKFKYSDSGSLKSSLTQLTTDMDYLQNYTQNINDNQVEQQYIKSTQYTANKTLFTDWYLKQLKLQAENNLSKMETSFVANLLFLIRENQIKDMLNKYQTYVLDTQTEWLSYLQQRLNEQIDMITKLRDLSNIESRSSLYVISDTITYNKISYWFGILFWVLLSLIVFVLLYRNYFDKVRESFGQLDLLKELRSALIWNWKIPEVETKT